MIKQFFLAMLVCIVSLSQTGCGLSIVQDWQASSGKAIIGGGAVAGKDYVNGLKPSENARKYFAKISANGDSPIETVRRTDDSPNKTGVRFVKNGGILIPPGVTISFTNKGYCMDPHLPAPKAGEEFQLVPMTQLIPEDLQGIYKKLLTKASTGDPSVQRNMQHLVWALRTAGTDAAFANNLTPQQKRILDRCSEYPGQFEEFNANAKANSKALKELIGLADSFLNIKIGGVSYKASDLLDPDVGNKKINEHLNQLIGMSQHLPVEKSGFNFGELQSGIYTDVRGTAPLKYQARIANSTNQPFIYYPTDYVGQVGSPTNSSVMVSYAAAGTTMRQRVTGENLNTVDVKDQHEPKGNPPPRPCPPHDLVGFKSSKHFDKQALSNLNEILNNLSQVQLDRFYELNKIRGEEAKNLGLQNAKEYVWYIYITKNGKIGSTSPVGGQYASVNIDTSIVPPGATVIASGHSHGSAEGFWNYRFNPGDYSLSAPDFLVAHQKGCIVFLCDPKGRMHVYNPLTGKYSFDKKGNLWTRIFNDIASIEKFEDEQYNAFKNGNKRCTKCSLIFIN